ncbi:MAG: thiamine biosynthesis protein ThiS [Bacteroidetes bacterium HGW-Bacteroidetes-4]|jgi:thiamine biosynthesis protein ThiS|nr:MAG: thiamine biosynthesis protein ThiS [Bacteroidetes bacterium HGW-Bacteroidetes-4]
MIIELNNRIETLEAGQLTVNELLELKNFTFRMLVIKINGHLVKKDQYDTALINDGDKVMVLHLVSGG